LAIVILEYLFIATDLFAVSAESSGSKSPTDQPVREKLLIVFVDSVWADVIVGTVFMAAAVAGDVSGTHSW
jgi:hypothetical protein